MLVEMLMPAALVVFGLGGGYVDLVYVDGMDIYVGRTEVTQAQWESVMHTGVAQQRDKANPFWSLGDMGPDYPMYYVNFEEAEEFCRRLSAATGVHFRLPTEQEWEYAAEGGERGRYSVKNMLDRMGIEIKENCNVIGIYGMNGGVWEWCGGDDTENWRIIRGSMIHRCPTCGPSERIPMDTSSRMNFLGFRVVCEVTELESALRRDR